MKKSLRTILAALLTLCFMLAFAVSAGAAEAAAAVIGNLGRRESGDIIEYDYINKTERVIPADSIPDYAATTTTTYELPSMASELARLATMAETNAAMEGGASTFSIIDPSKPFVKTPPKVNGASSTPYSGVLFLRLGFDVTGDGETDAYGRGTGFLVAPDVLVTAGHNIDHPDYVDDPDISIVEVRIYPYAHSARMPSWWYDESYIYPKSWICYEYSAALRDDSLVSSNYDWCVMKLQQPIYDVYYFACSMSTDTILAQEMMISGYPHCTNAGCTDDNCDIEECYQVTSSGNVIYVNDYIMRYTNNTRPGNSGGPVYLSQTNICYAIHTYSSASYNFGMKITRNVYNAISYYIDE